MNKKCHSSRYSEWNLRFKDVCELLEDDPHNRKPAVLQDEDNVRHA
jgi:hypothetical protein